MAEAAKNPFSKIEYACSVVNLLPFELNETKPMMIPSHFTVPAAVGDIPGIGYIKEGLSWIPNPLIEEGKPGSSFKQITTPAEMARSICEDYNGAHIALGDDAKPGLFWVEGKMTYEEIQKYHPEELATARRQQKNWFTRLVNLADADWQKNKNMLAVSDLQRIAANSLGVKKEWVAFINPDENIKCPMCSVTISSDSVICSSCKYIVRPDKYKKEAFA